MKQKIAIYGLGKETENNIELLTKQYEVIGLLDSYQMTGELYGCPVISIQEAINLGVQKIIVVARPGSCRAIARNIGSVCRENNIELFDIRGINLLKKEEVKYSFAVSEERTKKQLYKIVSDAEVVSFDLFDTLVMRKTLYYESFIKLLSYRNSHPDFNADKFGKLRLQAEIQLSKDKVPFLCEIYNYMFPDLSCELIDELVDLEYQLDKSVLVPRSDMVNIVNDIIHQGKKVFITTDTYYTEKQIREILQCCGVSQNVFIVISCENGTTKSRDLFEVLKNKAGTMNIVHIGDDLQADIAGARKRGIKSFNVQSGRELFDSIGGLNLSTYIRGLSDEIKVGMLISKLFNSPFVYENEGDIEIKTLQDIGYILFAPMIMDFVIWIGEYLHKNNIPNVLFSARDGFIMQKMYSVLWPKDRSIYFYTSRIAALRAGIESVDDIEYIEKTQFSGNIEDKLFIRYGIEEDEYKHYVKNNGWSKVTDFAPVILKKAVDKKENYLTYIKKNLQLVDGDIAFVDLSARGTIQMFCERLFRKGLKGLYFLQLEPTFAEEYDICIEPFYKDDKRLDNVIFDDFYVMEPVITSLDSSLDDFDDKGNPIFAKETRSNDEIRIVECIQEGMKQFANEYANICPREEWVVNKDISEEVFRLIHHLKIGAKDFYKLRNIDPFVNRITDIKVEV